METSSQESNQPFSGAQVVSVGQSEKEQPLSPEQNPCFGFATTFKSDEDWLDDWDEMEEKPKKPYTFDDRVNDYRYDGNKVSSIIDNVGQ